MISNNNQKNVNLIYFNGPMNGNFGDELSPYIVNNIIDKNNYILKKRDHNMKDINLVAIGSMIQAAKNDYHIWGSGILTDTYYKHFFDFRRLNVHAVRGPLTHNLLSKRINNIPQIYGDPALLCPEFYKPDKILNYTDKIGIVPHYCNYNAIDKIFKENKLDKSNYVIIHPCGVCLDVVKKIISCKAIISNSLHGLIISDAYNVPNVWLNTKIAQHNDFKFQDYFQSQGRESKFIEDITHFEQNNYTYNGGNNINLEALKDAFPFRVERKS